MVKLLYFASVRETVGLSEETVKLPVEVKSVSDLMSWQQQRGPEYKSAFCTTRQIRAAIDHQHANPDALVNGAHEIAFFPPVTGG